MSDQNKLTPEMFSKNNGIYFSPGDIVEGGFYGISHSDFMEYVDQFSPQTAAKDEEVKNLTEEVKSWKEKALDNEWHRIQKLEERIKELEKQLEIAGTKIGVSNMRIKTFEKATEEKNDLLKVNEARIAELEKERDELKRLLELGSAAVWGEYTDKVRVMDERDQAFDLLEKWKEQHPYIKTKYRKPNEYQKVQIARDTLLSSRENNKP